MLFVDIWPWDTGMNQWTNELSSVWTYGDCYYSPSYVATLSRLVVLTLSFTQFNITEHQDRLFTVQAFRQLGPSVTTAHVPAPVNYSWTYIFFNILVDYFCFKHHSYQYCEFTELNKTRVSVFIYPENWATTSYFIRQIIIVIHPCITKNISILKFNVSNSKLILVNKIHIKL